MTKATINEHETAEVIEKDGVQRKVLVRWFYNQVKDRITIIDADREPVIDPVLIGELRAKLRHNYISDRMSLLNLEES